MKFTTSGFVCFSDLTYCLPDHLQLSCLREHPDKPYILSRERVLLYRLGVCVSVPSGPTRSGTGPRYSFLFHSSPPTKCKGPLRPPSTLRRPGSGVVRFEVEGEDQGGGRDGGEGRGIHGDRDKINETETKI